MAKIIFLTLIAVSLHGCTLRVVVVNEKVRDLEMQNAALRAANRHLMELDYGRK